MPLRTRSASIGILNNVLSSAKSRRKRSGESEDVHSLASDLGVAVGVACAYTSPRSSKGSEDYHGASPRVSSKSSEGDCVASPKGGEGGVRRRVVSEMEGGMGTAREREERNRDSAGSGTSGSQESERRGKRRERRQVHLWEQL